MSSSQKLHCLFVCFSLFLTTFARETRMNIAYTRKPQRPVMLAKMSGLAYVMPSNGITQADPNGTSITNRFSLALKKHSEKHKAHTAFVSHMFKLFDLDGSHEINKREFRLVFQLLRIVDHNL